MTLVRRAVVITGAAAMLTLSACGRGDGSDDRGQLPDVELIGVGETAVTTGSWIGEPLVLNFWFSTCIPCATELVDFADVDEELGDRVRFIGVNPIDTPEAMAEFAAERGVEYDLFRDELAELQEEMKVASFPATYFIASDGTIVDATGVLDAETLRGKVDELLAEDDARREPTT